MPDGFRVSKAFDAYRAAGHSLDEAFAGAQIDRATHVSDAEPIYGVAIGDHDRLAPVVAESAAAASEARKAKAAAFKSATNRDLADAIDAASLGDRPDLTGLLSAIAARLRAR